MIASTYENDVSDVIGMRIAAIADVPDLIAIRASSVDVSTGLYRETDWQLMLESRDCFTYLLEDVKPFAYMTAGRAIEDYFDDYGEVRALYVCPEYRRRGFGRRLVVQGLSVLKRRDFARAMVWIEDGHDHIVDLVHGLKFESLDSSRTTNLVGASRVESSYGLDISNYF